MQEKRFPRGWIDAKLLPLTYKDWYNYVSKPRAIGADRGEQCHFYGGRARVEERIQSTPRHLLSWISSRDVEDRSTVVQCPNLHEVLHAIWGHHAINEHVVTREPNR
jgi:hypothetical protein